MTEEHQTPSSLPADGNDGNSNSNDDRTTDTNTNIGVKDVQSPSLSLEERVEKEMNAAKDMKISDLKMKLMAKGILTTSTFCEKSEFVRAYAEMKVKEEEKEAEMMMKAQEANANAYKEYEEEDSQDDDDDDDENDHSQQSPLPKCVVRRLEKLKELNDQREELMKQYLIERATLEAKYHEMTQPLYHQRREIVTGTVNDDDDQVNDDDSDNKDNNDNGDASPSPSIKGIPQFWVVALSQMPVTAEMIAEPDVDCLAYLQDITCSDFANGEGFTLSFHFAPNEYFENETLTKTYHVPNLLTADEPILKNVEGCDIRWKNHPNRDLTRVQVTRQQRGKGKNSGQIRTVTRKEKAESFFHFFTPPTMPSLDAMNEQEAVQLEAAFEEDYDVAQAIRSHIIPKAVMWFVGDAMEKEMEAAMQDMPWQTLLPQSTTSGNNDNDNEQPECKQS